MIEPPATFLTTVLEHHPDVVATAVLDLATNRRGVSTVADVLTVLDRNQTVRPFVVAARRRLL